MASRLLSIGKFGFVVSVVYIEYTSVYSTAPYCISAFLQLKDFLSTFTTNYLPSSYDTLMCLIFFGYPIWSVLCISPSCHALSNALTTSRKMMPVFEFLLCSSVEASKNLSLCVPWYAGIRIKFFSLVGCLIPLCGFGLFGYRLLGLIYSFLAVGYWGTYFVENEHFSHWTLISLTTFTFNLSVYYFEREMQLFKSLDVSTQILHFW